MGRESKKKYQMLLVFFLRESGDDGESRVPLLAPAKIKNLQEIGDFSDISGPPDKNRTCV